jgi:hypothetical protein
MAEPNCNRKYYNWLGSKLILLKSTVSRFLDQVISSEVYRL